MHISILTYTYIYIYVYIWMHISILTYTYIFIYVYIWMHVTYIYTIWMHITYIYLVLGLTHCIASREDIMEQVAPVNIFTGKYIYLVLGLTHCIASREDIMEQVAPGCRIQEQQARQTVVVQDRACVVIYQGPGKYIYR